MVNKAVRHVGWMLAACLAVATGCATAPTTNSALEQARDIYESARNDPAAVDAAPVMLDRAENELERAEALFEDGADAELVDHHAYLARRHAEIAIARSRIALAQSAIAAADARRQEVLLEARTREARLAEDRADARALEAEAALTSAEQSARQAAEAQARAEALRAETAALQGQLEELQASFQELQAKPTARGLVLTLSDVLFDTAEAELKPGAARSLDELVEFMNEYPERNILIEGFTDSRGSDTYNLDLSERRADAVKAALISEGIDPGRIQARGYGESYPVASNDSNAGRQLNRRVEIIISDDAGTIPARGPEPGGSAPGTEQ